MIKRILSEKERLEKICRILPAGKVNKDFSIFNENQRSIFYNYFGLTDFNYAVKTLNTPYSRGLLREQKKNPEKPLWSHLSCAEDNFYNSLENFLQVKPELRDERLKSRIIPYILEFEKKYVANPRKYMMNLLSILEYGTPNEIKKPFLRDKSYFKSLPKDRREALIEADFNNLKNLSRSHRKSFDQFRKLEKRIKLLQEILAM